MSDDVHVALAAPFDAAEVKWKPQTVSGNRAMVIAYIDARLVMDRLDECVGPGNWQDRFDRLPDGAVVCTLRVRLGGEWIEHQDVGGESEQPDEGDRTKAAFSDALKRAAVKFGIGRYLYRLPRQWVDYDPAKKQIKGAPQLPDWARPRPRPGLPGRPGGAGPAAQPARAPPAPPEKTVAERVGEFERRLVAQQLCLTGELIKYLEAKLGAKYGPLPKWPAGAAGPAKTACGEFESSKLLDALDEETGAKGVQWPGVLAHLRLPEKTTPTELTRGQLIEALDWARRLPRPDEASDGEEAVEV